MALRCHDLCHDVDAFEDKFGLRKRTQGTWNRKWQGRHIYSDRGARYCSICCVFMRLVVGKGGIESEEDAVYCPCCKAMLRTLPRNRKDRKRVTKDRAAKGNKKQQQHSSPSTV